MAILRPKNAILLFLLSLLVTRQLRMPGRTTSPASLPRAPTPATGTDPKSVVATVSVYDPHWSRPRHLTLEQAHVQYGLGVSQVGPSRWEQSPNSTVPCGDNTGNMAWALGAHQLLDYNKHIVVANRQEILQQTLLSSNQTHNYHHHHHETLIQNLYMGTGPMLGSTAADERPSQRARFRYMKAVVDVIQGPALILGMGPVTGVQDCNAGLGPKSVRFIRHLAGALEQYGGYVTLRGQCTQDMIAAAGISTQRFPVMGCPSLFLNRKPGLGRRMQTKFKQLSETMHQVKSEPRNNVGNKRKCLRLGILTSYGIVFDGLMEFIKDFACPTGNLHLVQEDGDAKLTPKIQQILSSHNIQIQPKTFYDMDTWADTVKHELDFVVGPRIHGTMLPLSVELPFVTVMKDNRIRELCQAMHLPSIPATTATQDFGKAVLDAIQNFDGAAFDANRRQKAARYVQIFSEVNLSLHPEVAALAENKS